MTELGAIHERLDAGGKIMADLKRASDAQGRQIEEIHKALAPDLVDPTGKPGILVRMAKAEMSLAKVWWAMGLLITALAVPIIKNLWRQ